MKRLIIIPLFAFLTGCGGAGDVDHLSIESGNLILTVSHGGDGAAWGLSDCGSCHPISVIHDNALNIRSMVLEKGYDTCTGCHGDNGTGKPRRCLVCHNMTDMPGKPYQSGPRSHNFVSGGTGGLSDGHCLVCHEASDMDGVFQPARDMTLFKDAAGRSSPYPSEPDFCIRCHNRDHQQDGFEITGIGYDDPLVAMEENYSRVDSHGEVEGSGRGTYAGLRSGYDYKTVVPCTDCHGIHGTANEALIIDNSLAGSLDPAIRNGSYTVDTTGGDFSQLCVLCHSMETVLDSGDVDTGNGLSGVHETGTDCRPCHTHGEAVQSGL